MKRNLKPLITAFITGTLTGVTAAYNLYPIAATTTVIAATLGWYYHHHITKTQHRQQWQALEAAGLHIIEIVNSTPTYISDELPNTLGNPPTIADLQNLIHPDDLPRIKTAWKTLGKVQHRAQHPTGKWRYYETTFSNPNQQTKLVTVRDVTRQHLTQHWAVTGADLLQRAAQGEPATAIIAAICATVEHLQPGLWCTLHTNQLELHTTSPSTPPQTLTWLTNPANISAPPAPHYTTTVPTPITELSPGTQAIWAYPIVNEQNEHLGVITYYLPDAHLPNRNEQIRLRETADTIKIILETELTAQKVTENEKLFRATFHGSPIGAALYKTDGTVIHANEAHTTMVNTQTYHWNTTTLPNGKPTPPLTTLANDQTTTKTLTTICYPHQNGATRHAAARITALNVTNPTHGDYLVQLIDITDDLTREKELNKLNSELTQRVTELSETREHLQQALTQLTRANQNERRRVSLALHDNTIQALHATRFALDSVLTNTTPTDRANQIHEIQQTLNSAISSIGDTIQTLYPTVLDITGIPGAITNFLTRIETETHILTNYINNLTERYPTHLEELTFRVVEEAVDNVVTHANATTVEVTTCTTPTNIQITVTDDGEGYQHETDTELLQSGRVGLIALTEAIRAVNGTLTVTNPPQHPGTTLTCCLPTTAPL